MKTSETWTVTIHRFQPKTGKHRNQTFTLAGSSDEVLKPTMTLAFGEANEGKMYDLVARTHAVLRIEILSDRNHIDIWTAPVVIRPYTEKLAKDYTDLTKKVYAPADDTSWMDDPECFPVTERRAAIIAADDLSALSCSDFRVARITLLASFTSAGDWSFWLSTA